MVVNHFAPIKYLRSWYDSFSSRSLSLARSLSCSVPGCHSFARVACEDREKERQRDRDRRSSSFCFYAPNLKCQPRWEVYQKIKRENNKHKQQDKKKTKRRDFTTCRERERSSIYRRDFFKTVSTNQPKNFEKAKQDEKYLDALSEARSILPLFLKDQHKANGRNPCVTTLYSLFRGRRTPPNNNNAHVLF